MANENKEPFITVNTLLFTVINEESSNYRKLPKKVLKVLLVKRKQKPYKDYWAIPSRFVNIDKNLEDTAKKELIEQTNIDDVYMEQLYTYGDVRRSPYSRVISCCYMSLVNSCNVYSEKSQWFEIQYKLIREDKKNINNGYINKKTYQLILKGKEILESSIDVIIEVEEKKNKIKKEINKSDNLAFDHALAIFHGIERLRNKIEYTDLAFNLMPDEFTLTELQQVYELILNKQLLKANFRRKIADMVIETDSYTKDKGHRPSKLYRFNPNWINFNIEKRY